MRTNPSSSEAGKGFSLGRVGRWKEEMSSGIDGDYVSARRGYEVRNMAGHIGPGHGCAVTGVHAGDRC